MSLEPLTPKQIADRLAHGPLMVRGLLQAQPPEALTFREAEGAWTPFEVVCHLADAEITNWMPRVRAILTTDDGRFAAFDREAGFERYRGWPLGELLAELERLRGENVAELRATSLMPAALARTGSHPALGVVTLEQLLWTWMTHDHGHTAQLARILTRFYGRGVGPWAQYFSLLSASR